MKTITEVSAGCPYNLKFQFNCDNQEHDYYYFQVDNFDSSFKHRQLNIIES